MSPIRARPARVLIVDDDVELVDMLGRYLTREGFNATGCHDGEQALALLSSTAIDATAIDKTPVDLLILDVMLPGRSGLDLLRQIVPQYPHVAIIMLTARGDAVDRILGLELGADDYLPKPFDPRELSARIRAVLRRRETHARPSTGSEVTSVNEVTFGSLRLDIARKQAFAHQQTLALTAAEFRVLQCLVQTPGTAVDRETLTSVALGRKLTLYDRSIDTHVSNLRRKLERSGASDVLIQSVRGAGYEMLERPT